MGQNPYPVEIAGPGGGPVKTAGDLTFTDPGNQPGGGSIPDPITTPLNVALTDPSVASLAITGGPAADYDDVIVVKDGEGDKTLILDSAGEVTLRMRDPGATALAIFAADGQTETRILRIAAFDGTPILVVHIDGTTTLSPPTADPHVAGALWNNAGTPTISSG